MHKNSAQDGSLKLCMYVRSRVTLQVSGRLEGSQVASRIRILGRSHEVVALILINKTPAAQMCCLSERCRRVAGSSG